MQYVYVLVSQVNKSKIYIGRTEDLDSRFRQHNSGQGDYSRRWKPWQIETYIAFSSESLAVKFEKYLKGGSGFAFLKKRFLPEIDS